jgi:carbonic anhydrase
MKNPVTVSREQVDAFVKVMHHPNNRPVQPVNARPVLQ